MFVASQDVLTTTVPSLPASGGVRPARHPLAAPHCSHCLLREWCLPTGTASRDVGCMDNLLSSRRRIRAGETLYSAGEPFKFLYEVRSGTLKSSLTHAVGGPARVCAFHMAGELTGLDGVAEGHHASTATALEDTEVCAISYALLTEMAESNATLQRTLMRQLSREFVRELHLLVLLGSMTSEKRLAAFLLNLSQRLSARGYSPSDFRMRMSRADIGSYLGLTLETVSRTFSAFQKLGLLDVDQRHIRIVNLAGLISIGNARAPKAPGQPAEHLGGSLQA